MGMAAWKECPSVWGISQSKRRELLALGRKFGAVSSFCLHTLPVICDGISVSFPAADTDYPDKSGLREKGLIVPEGWSVMVRKVWKEAGTVDIFGTSASHHYL